MSEVDVVQLVGYVKCYWQPDISCGDANIQKLDLPLGEKHAVLC